MCVLCFNVLSPCLRVCVVPKISHPPHSSKLTLSETYVCFFEKTEQGWKFQIPQNFRFWKFGFLMGGALIKVFMILYSLELYFEPTEFVMPQKIGHNQFFSALYFYTKLLIFYTWKKAKSGGLDFPRFVQIFAFARGFIFTVCFVRKVHRETIPKSTYRYSLEFSENLKLNWAIYALVWCFLRIGWRKWMIKKLGILHIMDSSLPEMF